MELYKGKNGTVNSVPFKNTYMHASTRIQGGYL